ncbi:LysR family transcriptional regulator [Pseudomonas abieticivorans]|uniref:LysR family transcriptional regulator n=1 Tax=Pseudomonas abieticivorans TaxID=2931382 RepID=UPI0020C0DF0F|nr:LysR family transcriptional regulator [Pseudomonas sp. PIA16]
MNLLGAISSFTQVVEAGSIAGAARTLGISAAAVSQNVARLEAHLGSRLLSRTTRSMALTDSGALYYQQVRHIHRDLERAHQAVATAGEPQGRLCVATTSAFGRHVLAPLIPGFKARYPKLTLEIISTDRRVNHLQEAIDVSLRIKPQLEDRLVARLIARVPFIFCAAPAYLAQAGWPQTPEDLKQHACLVFRYPVDGRFLRWGFIRDGVRFDAPLNASMISDDIDVLAQMAVHGGGITRLADFVAQPFIDSGQLVALFDDASRNSAYAEPEPMEVYACVTDHSALTAKTRAFIDYVQDCYGRSRTGLEG